jgi:hypothetical protein
MKKVQYTIIISEDLLQELMHRSREDGISSSEMVETALCEYFDVIESNEPALFSFGTQNPNERDPNKH